MTEKQKGMLAKARENAPLMSFASIIIFGAGAIFTAATFIKEFRDFKDQSLTVLEVAEIRQHMDESDDVKSYQALIDNTEATKQVIDLADSLKKDVHRVDSVSSLNATTIYQMKEGQARFFAEILREIRRSP